MKPGLIIPPPHLRLPVPLFGASQNIPAPAWLDYRPEMLDTSDQGSTPQCAAYSGAGIVERYRWKRDGVKEQIDPAPIYAYAKTIDGFPGEDGTSPEAVLKAIAHLKLAPVVESSIRVVKTLEEVKRALHKHGPIIGCLICTDAWGWATKSGWVADGGKDIGPHAVVLTGYDDETDDGGPYISFQNSWGDDEGWRGFMRMKPETFKKQFYYGYCFDLGLE